MACGPFGTDRISQDPTALELLSDRDPDRYLFTCNGSFVDIDWDRLVPIAQRVLLRLIVNKLARESHLKVLKQDDLEFHESALAEADHLLGVGPFSDQTPPLDYFRIIRDFHSIETLANDAVACSLSCWALVFADPSPPFESGDRDDRAARRLYEISKLCPDSAW